MSTIDWSKAPEWANAVISAKDGQEFYVSQFGGISARQRVGYCEVDNDHSAEMVIPHDWSLVATRRAPWAGEGLPPVGVKCEVEHGGKWIDCEVIAHFQQESAEVAAFIFSPYSGQPKCKELSYYVAGSFRSVRTPEKIAADKRLHEIRNACTGINYKVEEFNANLDCSLAIRATIEAMIDAGYRKQVMP